MIPERIIPAPRYYAQSKGRISFGAKHIEPSPNKHYASWTLIRSMDYAMKHEEKFFDDSNPQFAEKDLKESSCKVCGKYFPTKKLRLSHRAVCHPYWRENNKNKKDKDGVLNNDDELLNEAEKDFYASITRICDERNGQYLAEMNDESKMWVILDNDDERVTKYLEEKNKNGGDGKIPNILDLNAWNLCPWAHAEDYKNDNNNWIKTLWCFINIYLVTFFFCQSVSL